MSFYHSLSAPRQSTLQETTCELRATPGCQSRNGRFIGEGDSCRLCTAAHYNDPRSGIDVMLFEDGTSRHISEFADVPKDRAIPGREVEFRRLQKNIKKLEQLRDKTIEDKEKREDRRLRLKSEISYPKQEGERYVCRFPLTFEEFKWVKLEQLCCERDIAVGTLAVVRTSLALTVAELELCGVDRAGPYHRDTHERQFKGWSSRVRDAEAHLSQLEEQLRNFPAAPSP